MKRLITAALASAMIIGTPSFAEESTPTFKATEVAPGIHMLSGVGGFTGGNIGLSIGEDGVVMIDDSMPPMLDNMKKAIESVTTKPVNFLINTHVHGDHTGNNSSMANDGAHIVAHKNLREHLIKKGIPTGNGKMQKAPESFLPVITFTHSMSFHLNGDEANLIHTPHAHTDGDAIIHFKKANVIHAGDVFFNGMYPYIDVASGGSVDGYIKAQEHVISLANDKTKIIPGHGPLANKKDLENTLAMVKDVRKIIKKLIKDGKSEDEAVNANPLKQYHDKWNWQFITTEKMIRQVYQSLTSDKKHKHNGKEHRH
ncbi:MBL fold metallo-hydrolase [Pleionea sediminis]|uniref:MBL fold metallo-hydrolase n=1 Tax=Pleionea sediminis TaxID=2569479 RepID=UPI001186F554|nr:MBL fold metallo-hydrolase [Pleionea sediminis]